MTDQAKTMAEVLAEHQRKTGLRDMLSHCWCGWAGEMTDRAFVDHQAAALSAAGFGLVADAGAKALEDAAADPKLRLAGHSGISITRLRARAASIRSTDAHG